MATYTHATVPSQGERIGYENGTLLVPANPIIPFIEGDGTGPDIWRASVRVFDAAVQKAYGGKRKITWTEVLAGQKAYDGPTHEAIARYREALRWAPESVSARLD